MEGNTGRVQYRGVTSTTPTMSTIRFARVLATLPVFAASAAAQDSTTARDTMPRVTSVAPAPAGARREPQLAAAISPDAPRTRAARHPSDHSGVLVVALGGLAIGAASGALHGDACFGDADRMGSRALVAGTAVGIPLSMLANRLDARSDRRASEQRIHPASSLREGERAAAAPAARQGRTGLDVRTALAMPVVGAAFGAVLGAPIGAVQGARLGARCHGGVGGATRAGTEQMAIGGAAVGVGAVAMMGLAELAMRMAGDAAHADSLAARARRAGIRPDTLRGLHDPHRAALFSFGLPGAAHVRAGEVKRGLTLGGVTGALLAVAMYNSVNACAEHGAGDGCTRASEARTTALIGTASLAWALTIADGYGAAERHNRRVVERAVAATARPGAP